MLNKFKQIITLKSILILLIILSFIIMLIVGKNTLNNNFEYNTYTINCTETKNRLIHSQEYDLNEIVRGLMLAIEETRGVREELQFIAEDLINFLNNTEKEYLLLEYSENDEINLGIEIILETAIIEYTEIIKEICTPIQN